MSQTNKTAFWRNHGLSDKNFWQILKKQGFCCADCKNEIKWPKPDPYSASIDHDHDHCPGEYGCPKCVLAVVCVSCNVKRMHEVRRAKGLSLDRSKVMSWRRKRPWLV